MRTVWAKKKHNIKNCTIAFSFSADVAGTNAKLEMIAVNIYRLFVNGELVGYGPARACHGYVRKDVYDLSAYIKEPRIT